ncbi:glycoside hydrolase family 31 protein [Clostridium saccharoperbutylacetonicum]|uniref:glycoside hydrolase family 31 protein n=1 Tax=Clostridium saccharoperbutylacetonicum TaxID=36745 RepID=UPI000983A7DF|nr:glycoside hydrolase family 31 protein [Clostridium saccharoperbutylacetonicum]AQR96593.1 alpha-xylosidase BoGH31A precursor [Clostridium saccharoperbutylacetonicum]NSB32469.1 alpha-glucosidase [Clostridium saccharoperbutylacetonicum]
MDNCKEVKNSYGKLLGYEVENNIVNIEFEEEKVYIKIVNSYIINFFVPSFRKERNSKAVENLKDKNCDFEVEFINGGIQISTEQLQLKVYDCFKVDIYDKEGTRLCADYRGDSKPFNRRYGDYMLAEAEGHAINNQEEYKLYISKNMEEEMYFYGLGEKTGHLNKKGYHYVNWNTDNAKPHGETFDRLYKSIPFLIGLSKGNAFGIFFDNHFETYFDMGRDNSEYYYFAAADGNLDYYFIYGPSVKKVVEGYTIITGNMPLPALWTLGYQQCRWSYDNETRLMEIANSFREKGIPCDTLYLDIDYMDGYRVFTWNKERFENPEAMIKNLNNMGFKVVTIIDPGVKVDKGYKTYDEGLENGYFATDNQGIVYRNEVWPGDSVYPDFLSSKVRKWWGENQKIMTDTGVSGIWNDMNEPASFNGPLPDDVMFNNDGILVTHKEVHNIYGHMMAKATYEGLKKATGKRPFIVTRACYAGTQKYSTVWTGDNQSTWEHLRMSIPMLMNLGLSGMAFCGTDVGGFGHDCSAELLSRWVQVGTFTPLFRNHSAMGTRDQEPWAFDEITEEINRKYIKLRYKLLPYLYDMMWRCSKNGEPIIRPLLFNYQNDKKTYEINDEFLCGENILVAPVVEQGAKARMLYLPEGNSWIDYWTKEECEGGQYIIKETPVDVCPIYVKGGSIIPIGEDQNYIGEKSVNKLTIEVYLSKENTETRYHHYNDDGESFRYQAGEFNHYKIKTTNLDEKVEIKFKAIDKGYKEKYENIEFIIYNLRDKDLSVNGEVIETINGKAVISNTNK